MCQDLLLLCILACGFNHRTNYSKDRSHQPASAGDYKNYFQSDYYKTPLNTTKKQNKTKHFFFQSLGGTTK